MAAWHARFPFDFVIMLGDNLYGSQQPKDFVDEVRAARTSRCSTPA